MPMMGMMGSPANPGKDKFDPTLIAKLDPRILLKDALGDLGKVVESSSDHEKVRVTDAWDTSTDRYAIRVRCAGCGKDWLLYVNGSELAEKRTVDDLTRFFRGDVIPFFQKITKESCYSMKEGALLAEWITERLVSAGPAGLPYIQIIHEASEARYAPPQDVDTSLRKLGFITEWVPIRPLVPASVLEKLKYDPEWRLPVLRLPLDHPHCTWREEDLP